MPVTDQHESVPYEPSGSPVRSFAVLLAGVGALALVLWWSGLLAPRLDVDGSSAGSFDHETLEGDISASVRNAGALPLRIERITVGGPGYRSTGSGILSPDPNPDSFGDGELVPFEPTELAPGRWAELRIGFAVDACRTDDPEVELRVRTPAGLHRSVAVEGRDLMAMFCADRPPG